MKKYSWAVAVSLALIACLYAFFQFLKPLDVFLWDEAHHGFYGMQIYLDLWSGDWVSFWAHTNSQALWMPLHSWFNGFFLWIFGFSYASARLSSLFLFFVSALVVYFIALELSKEKGWLVGLIGSVLFLTSPMMLHLATVNMQEMLGIFICLLTVYFMVRHESQEANRFSLVRHSLLIGFLLSVSYWAKQNFAMFMIMGVGLYQLSLLWDKKKLVSWVLNNLYIVAGFLPLFLLWWMTPPFDRKYALTVTFRQGAVSEGGSAISGFFGTAIFYLQSFVTSYNLSFWLALGGLVALVASFFIYKEKKIRIISLMFMANLIFISIMSFAQERYLSSTAPLAFILLSYFGVIAIDRLVAIKKYSVLVYVVLTVIALSFVYDLSCLNRFTKEVANRTIMSVIYKDTLNGFSPPFLFGLSKRPNFTFPLDSTKDKFAKNFKATPTTSLQDALDFFSLNIPRNRSISTMISYAQISPYVIYWHFNGWGASVLSVNDLGYNPGAFWSADYFIDIQATEDSPYYADWIEKRWDQISKVLLNDQAIRLEKQKEFADLGLTAKIYKREKNISFR